MCKAPSLRRFLEKVAAFLLYADGQMPAPRARARRDQRLLLGLFVLTGCTGWRTAPVSPVDLLTPEPPSRIRITRVDESRVELHHPQLAGDTIIDGRARRGIRTKVPLSDVASVAVRKWDPLKTAGLVLGTAAVGAVVAIGLVWDTHAD